MTERALLIQPFRTGQNDPDHLEEFTELAHSAGAEVVSTLLARIEKINPATFIGSGKVEEALAVCDALDVDLILINHTLSPIQERNLQRALQRRVVDRTGLILDIFAQRARSHEGKLQVELAQLGHLSTRLVHRRTNLDGQHGGTIGLRGPGETQLETDRRLLARRVDSLKARLEKVEVQREQMSRARLRSGAARVALVGYTNAGKSSLFNALTGAGGHPNARRSLRASSVEPWLALIEQINLVEHENLRDLPRADLIQHFIDLENTLFPQRIRRIDNVQ